MNKHRLILALAVALAAACPALALDTMKTKSGTIAGRVTQISPLQVIIEQAPAGIPKEVPVNQIEVIFFDGEPSTLKSARAAAMGGRYEEALEALEKIPAAEADRKEVTQDIEFYKAICAARLALGGQGKVIDAGRQMLLFSQNHKDSFHFLEACEVVGDLLVAAGKFQDAENYYARVNEAPWPDYKMRAAVLLGNALLAQNKTDEAAKHFDKVLAAQVEGPQADAERVSAKLGKARCMAAGQQAEEAIKMIEDLILKSDPENVNLHAQAYNALGTALRKAGRKKEALLAFLHVDVLYPNLSSAHAEALANLADLWNDLGKTERAVQARQLLEERYRNTSWAQKGQ